MIARICVGLATLVMAGVSADAQHHSRRNTVCDQVRTDRGAAGAVIGGVLGGVVGADVAADGVRTEGAILGAALGAALGNEIGEDTVNCGRRYTAHGYGHGLAGTTRVILQSSDHRHGRKNRHTRRSHDRWHTHGRRSHSHAYSGRHSHSHNHNTGYGHTHGYTYPYTDARSQADWALQYGYFGNWNDTNPHNRGSDRRDDDRYDDRHDDRYDDWDDDGLRGGRNDRRNQSCRNVRRETVLPNGSVVIDTVRACADRNGDWRVRDRKKDDDD